MIFKGSFQPGASCDSVSTSINKCSSWRSVTICDISMRWTLITWMCDGYGAQWMSRKNTKSCCYQHGFLSEGQGSFQLLLVLGFSRWVSVDNVSLHRHCRAATASDGGFAVHIRNHARCGERQFNFSYLGNKIFTVSFSCTFRTK